MGTVEKLRRLPLPWWQVWRVAEALGAKPKRPVIFECVGAPGVIDEIIAGAPLFSRVVVVGVCMGADRIRPAMAINKEIDLRFVVGYTPLEFRDTLQMLAEGKVDPSGMVTGMVGLDGVEAAFGALGRPRDARQDPDRPGQQGARAHRRLSRAAVPSRSPAGHRTVAAGERACGGRSRRSAGEAGRRASRAAAASGPDR